MIRNIVFDMGNVMIYFNKNLFLDRAGVTGEDRRLLERIVFDSLEWARLDRGSLLEPEAERLMCSRLPERLHGYVREFVYDWDKPLYPVRGMAPLVRELKEKGYGIYLLSNAASRQHEYWPRIPASRFFDGTLISIYGRVLQKMVSGDRVTLRVATACALTASSGQIGEDLGPSTEFT